MAGTPTKPPSPGSLAPTRKLRRELLDMKGEDVAKQNQDRGLDIREKTVKVMKMERFMFELEVPSDLQRKFLDSLGAADMVDTKCSVGILRQYMARVGLPLDKKHTKVQLIAMIIQYWVGAPDLDSVLPISNKHPPMYKKPAPLDESGSTTAQTTLEAAPQPITTANDNIEQTSSLDSNAVLPINNADPSSDIESTTPLDQSNTELSASDKTVVNKGLSVTKNADLLSQSSFQSVYTARSAVHNTPEQSIVQNSPYSWTAQGNHSRSSEPVTDTQALKKMEALEQTFIRLRLHNPQKSRKESGSATTTGTRQNYAEMTAAMRQRHLDEIRRKGSSAMWTPLPVDRSDHEDRQSVRSNREDRQRWQFDREDRQPMRSDREDRQPVRSNREDSRPVQSDQKDSRPVRSDREDSQRWQFDREDRQPMRSDREDRQPVRSNREDSRPVQSDREDSRPVQPDREDRQRWQFDREKHQYLLLGRKELQSLRSDRKERQPLQSRYEDFQSLQFNREEHQSLPLDREELQSLRSDRKERQPLPLDREELQSLRSDRKERQPLQFEDEMRKVDQRLSSLGANAPAWLELEQRPATLTSIKELGGYLDQLEKARIYFASRYQNLIGSITAENRANAVYMLQNKTNSPMMAERMNSLTEARECYRMARIDIDEVISSLSAVFYTLFYEAL
ncbi:hypothetical protein GGR51DRAFT_570993 [Nemania sp. FL0031]|nr:hypothetical protein GGR51DRAFT_570993 [Nemania sp. FL0031]